MSLYNYLFDNFEYIISVDSEFRSSDHGDKTEVVCFVYQDLRTGKIYDCPTRESIAALPFPHDEAVYVVFNAFAEADAWINWNVPIPSRIIDLWIENKNLIQDGLPREKGFYSELSAGRRYKIPEQFLMSDEQKDLWRKTIINNKSYTDKEFKGILRYCRKDTVLCGKILKPTFDHIDLRLRPTDNETRINQIFFRGKAKSYEAKMYNWGIHVDVPLVKSFLEKWPKAKENFIKEKDKQINCFENGTFKQEKFKDLLIRNNLINVWPTTATGKPKSDKGTLGKYKANKDIQILREMLRINSSDKLLGYNLGKDFVSRERVNWFSTITGRTAPSTSKFPFNSPRWTREFIKPPKDYVYAYIDYKAQEPHIMAYLSDDKNFIEAVGEEDVYIATARLSGHVPKGATKKSHPYQRGIFKVGVLATGYSMGIDSLARTLQENKSVAKEVYYSIRKTYSKYFLWSKERVSLMMKQGRLQTIFGWTRHLPYKREVNARSISNWPIQATAGEMTRLAYVWLIDAGYIVSATVHDAVLILVPKENHEQHIERAQEIMSEASEMIIGHKILTDADIITERFYQERKDGKEAGDMFDDVMREIEKI